ncbi:heparin lyase I family protein, partial [Patulibacter sp. S7RM1-6]
MHATRPGARRALLTAAATVLVAAPTAASAAVTPKTADMDGGSFAGFDQTNASGGALSVDGSRTYEGAGAAHATYTGGGANGFTRGIFNLDWRTGDDVWFGAAFYLPTGFKAAMQSETDLMRYDDYGQAASTTNYGGIGLLRQDRKAHLYRLANYVNGQPGTGTDEDMNVVAPFDLPEGRWFWLEVHQKLGVRDGDAVNEVWIDDTKVGSSTKANSFGTAVTRLRYGIVSIGQDAQTNPLELWFDRAMVRDSRIGPLAGTAAPAPGTDTGAGTGTGPGTGTGSGGDGG